MMLYLLLGDDDMYKHSANRHLTVALCIILVMSSFMVHCPTQSHTSVSVCYIMPVYKNIYSFAVYNKQFLENDNDADIQWIKESANVDMQDRMQERLMPSHSTDADIARYTAVAFEKMQRYSYNKGRMYHMLN